MTGQERIKTAINGGKTDRLPWVPYIGVHGAGLIGVKVSDYMNQSDAMIKGIEAIVKNYDPDGILVAFDLQAEAEALGCGLKWYDNAPPSVISHPLREDMTIPGKDVLASVTSQGRLHLLLEVAAKAKVRFGEKKAVYGLVTGPLTLAAHLRGDAFMMDIVLNSTFVRRLIEFTASVTKVMVEAYAKAGVDVIAVVDPMASQISPGHFESLIGRHLTEIFALIKAKGCISSLFVCGSVDKQLAHMCFTKPDMISIDENTDLDKAYSICEAHGILLAGNIPVSTLLLHGSKEDNARYAASLMETFDVKKCFFMATGCDVPYDVPIENLMAVRSLFD